MSARRSAAVTGATALLGLAVSGAAHAAPQTRSTPGFCPSSNRNGVTVVVDFRSLGGGIQAGCVKNPTPGMSGLEALHAAGFSTVGTQEYGDSVVCRIQGKPADDPCVRMPAADYYWSYWQAPNGGSWKYSNWGVKSTRVIMGGFEGYSFLSTNAQLTPRIAPSRPVSSPSPTTTRTTTTRTSTTRTTRTSATTSRPPRGHHNGGHPRGDHHPRPTRSTTTSDTRPTSSHTTSSTSSTSTSQTSDSTTSRNTKTTTSTPSRSTDLGHQNKADKQPKVRDPSGEAHPKKSRPAVHAVDTHDDDAGSGGSGVPLGTLAGAGVVGVLALGAGVAAWRRKHS